MNLTTNAVRLITTFWLCLPGCSWDNASQSSPQRHSCCPVQLSRFEYTGHRVTLISEGVAEPLRLSLSYSRSLSGLTHQEETVYEQAAVMGTTENRWLQAYLNKAAFDFANESTETKFVTIRVLNPEALDQSVTQGWFFGKAGDVEWCIDTLSWRHGGDVITFLSKDKSVVCEQWLPLTADSYGDWFRLLDQRARLSALFGP